MLLEPARVGGVRGGSALVPPGRPPTAVGRDRGEAAGRVRNGPRHHRHACARSPCPRSCATRPPRWSSSRSSGSSAPPGRWASVTPRRCSPIPARPSEQPGQGRLLVALRGMGQIPFRPPSVGGWPAGGALAHHRGRGGPAERRPGPDREGRPDAPSPRRRPGTVRRRSAGCWGSTPSPPGPPTPSARSPIARPTPSRWPRSPPSTSSPAEGSCREPEPPPSHPSTRVHPVTRRRFLAFSGVAAAGALAVGATRINWTDLVAAAERTPLDPERRRAGDGHPVRRQRRAQHRRPRRAIRPTPRPGPSWRTGPRRCSTSARVSG